MGCAALDQIETAPEKPRFNVSAFFLTLVLLQALRIAIGYTAVPISLVAALTILTTAIFVAVPIFAVFKAAANPWSSKLALLFIVVGAPLQFGLVYAAKHGLTGFSVLLALSVAQIALFTWCVGLGALLATLIKDKNLFIPITICLALLDVYLIFAPSSITRFVMEKAPEVLPSMGASIPKVQTTVSSAPVGQFATIGPADFVFLGMLFIALFRFNLRTRQTLLVLVPTVLVYLVLAAIFGAIPLLPPIVLTVLFVNLKEFKLTKEEWISTGVVSAFFLGVLIYGLTRPPQVEIVRVPPVGPSNSAPGPKTPGSGGSPGQAGPDRRPSSSPAAPGSTPDRP